MTPPSGQRVPSALERRLLDAARREGPRESARRRTMLAVAGGAAIGSVTATSGAAATMGAAGGGTGAATAVIGSAKVTAGVATLAGVAKALAVGALSGAVVLGAAQKIQSPREVASPRASKVAVSETRSAPPRPVAPTLRSEAAADVPAPPRSIEEPLVDPMALPKAPALRSAVQAPVERISTSPPSSFPGDGDATSLGQEIALLDRARESLLAGDPRRAIAVLDAYERARVGTSLAAEATLLRIEALLGSGEPARAASLASAFLRSHPESPVADRMRAIIHDASP